MHPPILPNHLYIADVAQHAVEPFLHTAPALLEKSAGPNYPTVASDHNPACPNAWTRPKPTTATMTAESAALAATAALDADTPAHLALDAADPLRGFRSKFHLPTPKAGETCDEFIYFDGNSLGLQPTSAKAAIQEVLGDWAMEGAGVAFGPGGVGYGGVECRRHPQQDRAAELAAPMVGASSAAEICWMNALTVNLHLLLASFYRPSGNRTKILMEAGAFPSDQYEWRYKCHIFFTVLN